MIEDWRKEIDRVDVRILGLLNERASLSSRIGKFKFARSLPFYCAEREEEILKSLRGGNTGPLEPDAVERIFRIIIEESRALSARGRTIERRTP